MANEKTLNIKPDMTKKQIALAYSDYFNLPFIDLANIKIDQKVLDLVSKETINQFKIIPYQFNEHDKIIRLAVTDPKKLQQKAPQEILNLKNKGFKISLSIATDDSFDKSLKEAFFKPKIEPTKEIKSEKEIKPEKEIEKPKFFSPHTSSKLPEINLIGKKIPYDVLNKFPREIAEKYQMVVFDINNEDNIIQVAVLNPHNDALKEILSFISKRNNLSIDLYKTSRESLQYALKLYQEKPVYHPVNQRRDNDNNIKNPTIPLAKPIPNFDKINSNLPPLTLKNKNLDEKPIDNKSDNKTADDKSASNNKPTTISNKEIEKPSGEAEVKVEDINPQHDESAMSFIPVLEEEENNLDKLFSSGIKNDEELSKIIKSGIIPKIISAIVYYAVELEASDIHLEPLEEDLNLRYRVDGLLKDIIKMPKELIAPLVSRIKIISKLKIDEQRIPQDGRFGIIALDKDIDLRISTLPTIHGEKIVMRILDKSGAVKKIEEMGFAGTNLKKVKENISKPHGLILATGPTGSGKSTTLYAILNEIAKPEVNIVTLEDPVEYNIPGINQCQIKPKIGFGFAEGLRSIVRQDPDIIMVGEIRDTETAEMCTHAALTGHLVLSTLHTNNAAGALPRLIDMGVEPFLITSSINCIIAQRLVRKICDHCKEEYTPPAPIIEDIKEELAKSKNPEVLEYQNKELKFFRGKGCEECNKGYKGRIGIYEVLEVSEQIESLTVHKEPASKIEEKAIEEGMTTIKQDGIIKAVKGITSLDEVLRVTSSD